MRSWIPILGRFLIALVFIFAGAMKVIDPKEFARTILDYQLLPSTLVPAVAVLLPWWEVVAGILVVAGPWRRGALSLLTVMAVGFLVVGIITVARGLSPECGCFGMFSERVGPMSLAVELVTLVVSAGLLWWELRSDSDSAV